MKRPILLAALALCAARPVLAHVTYNVAGYDAGLAGSTNGADGQPAASPSGTWTNGGVSEYAGGLPVMWYAGMHDTTTLRVIQTGTVGAPASGSLAGQVATWNAGTDPDLPTDRVLAVGGKSWVDPDNAGQGWGHGLDYGLIHFSPVDELLADGPVDFTVTVTDDPSDAATVQLAFALYAGWDASGSGSSRHQTFTTDPAPVDAPLGAGALTLVGYAVAASAGAPVSKTFHLDALHDGRYTLLVGAQGGVSGQYQVTITPALVPPDEALAVCVADLATKTADLATCETSLATATADADGDGRADAVDACAATPAGEPVDTSGCSHAQFCAGFDVGTKTGARICKAADWQNDEPLMKKRDADCTLDKKAKLCAPAS